MTLTEKQAAEHAGLWKAERGKAPHYTAKGFLTTGWTCIACPLDECDWHHDDPVARPAAPGALNALVREHLESHDLVDFLRSLQTARNGITAVREANNRAWDVVNLHRLKAIHRGEHPTTDPLAQMLSAALVGTPEHEDVRRELTELSGGVAGAQHIASVPAATPGPGASAENNREAVCGAREPEPRTGTSPCVLAAGHGGLNHQDKWTNQWPKSKHQGA